MNEDFVETTLIRLAFILIAKMPFTEDARRIGSRFNTSAMVTEDRLIFRTTDCMTIF